MADKDPRTQLYEFLWTKLEANTAFTTLVPANNRVKLVGDDAMKYPELDSRQPSEWPQVMLEPALGNVHFLYASCGGEKIKDVFRMWIRSGDKRLCYSQGSVYQGVFPVLWAAQCALRSAVSDLTNAVTLTGYTVTVGYLAGGQYESQEGSPRTQLQQTPVNWPGWNLAWQGEFETFIKESA